MSERKRPHCLALFRKPHPLSGTVQIISENKKTDTRACGFVKVYKYMLGSGSGTLRRCGLVREGMALLE